MGWLAGAPALAGLSLKRIRNLFVRCHRRAARSDLRTRHCHRFPTDTCDHHTKQYSDYYPALSHGLTPCP
jgi:hypothetical protein